jgi:pimeloyl-ACP methyl ester carboxylesterase
MCVGLMPASWAEPSPPTNGGNGAGQSGQCTGAQDDRPASCKSQGGRCAHGRSLKAPRWIPAVSTTTASRASSERSDILAGTRIELAHALPARFPAEKEPHMATITQRETQQVDQANARGTTPVVFIHGLWLLPSSWDRWAQLFEDAGYAAVAPSWPDDPETVEEARANPAVFAKKTLGQIADHTAEVIGKLTKKPAVMGHSTGGLLAQIIADRGLSAATVAIDPGPFRGVLPLPISALRSAGPVLANPLNRGRAVTLTLDQFKYGWANALSDEEAKQLHETYHVAAPGVALMQMANANLNPWTEAKLDPKNPDRGPLLIIDGEKDHTVPWAIANASYKRQRRNQAVTEIVKIPNRGHSLTIDGGWREVADTALAFVKRFV